MSFDAQEPAFSVMQLLDNLSIPEHGMANHSVYQSADLKVVLLAFAAGHVMAEHKTSFPATMHVLKGSGHFTIGAEEIAATAGTWVHMKPELLHSVQADTELALLLYLLKGSAAAGGAAHASS